MNAVWRDPLWWRYRVGNPALAALPLVWQYRAAERWGRYRSRNAEDAAAIRQGALMLGAVDDEAKATSVIARYHGLVSRIQLDDHRIATAAIADVVAQVRLHPGAEQIARKVDPTKGLIILTAHYGRWAMIVPAMHRLGLTSSLLTATTDARSTGFSAMQRWVAHRNGQSYQRFGLGQRIMVDDPATRLRGVLRRGQPLIVAIDAFSTRSPKRYTFRFGPGTLVVPTGIVRLAEATGAPLVLALMHDLGNERVEMRCWDLPTSPKEAVQNAFDLLAQFVHTQPWQWRLLPHTHAFWRPDADQASH